MYPILLCSIVSVAILFERLFALRKSRIIANRDLMMHLAEKHAWNDLKEAAQKGDDLFSRVVYMTLDLISSCPHCVLARALSERTLCSPSAFKVQRGGLVDLWMGEGESGGGPCFLSFFLA